MLTIYIPCLSANNSRINLFCLISRRRSCLSSSLPIYTPTTVSPPLAPTLTDTYIFGQSTGGTYLSFIFPRFMFVLTQTTTEQKGKQNSRNKKKTRDKKWTTVAYSCMGETLPAPLTLVAERRIFHLPPKLVGLILFFFKIFNSFIYTLTTEGTKFWFAFSLSLSVCCHASRS